jgi:hypothetical protein
VLDFGGEQGSSVRERLVAKLGRRYRIVPGKRLSEACEELGIPIKRGENLAKAAQRIGVVAVLGGAVKAGVLTVAVYSSATGQTIALGRIPLGRRLTGRVLARALKLINAGLRKAPREIPRSAADTTGGAETTRRARTGDEHADGDSAEKEPSQAPDSASGKKQQQGDSLTYDPKAASDNASDEKFDPAAGNPMDTRDTSQEKQTRAAETGKKVDASESGWRQMRVEATAGVGTWLRSFSLNDSLGDPISYSSGAAFALRFAARIHPASFFSSGIAADFWLRLSYQMVVGLESRDDSASQAFGTSMGELLIDVGYAWNFLKTATSPELDIGIGFGLYEFKIDWAGQVAKLPNWSYRFLLFGVGARFPFVRNFGAYVRADYRLVFGSGDVEDDLSWYGASKTGGIALSFGFHGSYKGFVARADYSYTRYFYSFEDPVGRQLAGRTRVAGGALDQSHAILVSAGYQY